MPSLVNSATDVALPMLRAVEFAVLAVVGLVLSVRDLRFGPVKACVSKEDCRPLEGM